MNEIRKQRWSETTAGLDFTNSSHKAWGLMKRLGDLSYGEDKQRKVRPNEVASRLIEMGKIKMCKEYSKIIKAELKRQKKLLQEKDIVGAPFTKVRLILL